MRHFTGYKDRNDDKEHENKDTSILSGCPQDTVTILGFYDVIIRVN